jgi:SAM-dependent methyltransferase
MPQKRKSSKHVGKKIQSPPWDGQRETLDDLSAAINYNRWIYGILCPYIGKRILEIGCGTGNITGFLASHGQVLATDFNQGYLDAAKNKLKGVSGISYKTIDLGRSLSSLRSFKPDSIICVNVLEHISDDRKVLDECFKLLPPGGKLSLFVPALQYLYGSMDISYGHHRRYNRLELIYKIENAGYHVEYCRYLNLLGILGWWLNGKILKRKIIPKSQMLLYDRIVSFSQHVEKFLPKPIGLSLFCAATKPK